MLLWFQRNVCLWSRGAAGATGMAFELWGICQPVDLWTPVIAISSNKPTGPGAGWRGSRFGCISLMGQCGQRVLNLHTRIVVQIPELISSLSGWSKPDNAGFSCGLSGTSIKGLRHVCLSKCKPTELQRAGVYKGAAIFAFPSESAMEDTRTVWPQKQLQSPCTASEMVCCTTCTALCSLSYFNS